MTNSVVRRGRSDPGAVWPGPGIPVTVLVSGAVVWADQGRRDQAAIRLFWAPARGSRFWTERGSLAAVVNTLVRSDDGQGGRSLADRLERRGVGLEVTERASGCCLDLTGAHESLGSAAAHICQTLTSGTCTEPALDEALRILAEERRGRHLRPVVRADARRWKEFVVRPERFWNESNWDAADADDLKAMLDAERTGLAAVRATVVGPERLADVWADQVAALRPGGGAPGAETVVATDPRHTRVTEPGVTSGNAFISYGSVFEASRLEDVFAVELALEFLAGWSGSRLSVVLREERSLTYAVMSKVAVAGIGGRLLCHWDVGLQAARTHIDEVCRTIGREAGELREKALSEADVRRAGARIIRRLRVFADAPSDLMRQVAQGVEVQRPDMTEARRRFLAVAEPEDVRRALDRMAGMFVVVDPAAGSDTAGHAEASSD